MFRERGKTTRKRTSKTTIASNEEQHGWVAQTASNSVEQSTQAIRWDSGDGMKKGSATLSACRVERDSTPVFNFLFLRVQTDQTKIP
jgi:hypothetical protein